jgi:hypothetical protein
VDGDAGLLVDPDPLDGEACNGQGVELAFRALFRGRGASVAEVVAPVRLTGTGFHAPIVPIAELAY